MKVQEHRSARRRPEKDVRRFDAHVDHVSIVGVLQAIGQARADRAYRVVGRISNGLGIPGMALRRPRRPAAGTGLI